MLGSARNATWGTVLFILAIGFIIRFLFGQQKK
jgi:uncharacterized membrane protein YczE